jgi:DNA-binding transcriptional regulator PaaX
MYRGKPDSAGRGVNQNTIARRNAGDVVQRSVWISPRDIRPAYDDLARALQIDVERYLVEAKTVLGRDPQELVRAAWNWKRIDLAQQCYLDIVGDQLKLLRTASERPPETVQTLAREELDAYFMAMQEDPLLPKSLWPMSYKGKTVFPPISASSRQSKPSCKPLICWHFLPRSWL